jgi:hypothetical protein
MANVVHVEFGVGRESDEQAVFSFIPTDDEVQNALKEMVVATQTQFEAMGKPSRYDPAEKHAPKEYLILPLSDGLSKTLLDLRDLGNVGSNAGALTDPSLFCYFAKLKDKRGRHLTAIRRATQFKGTVGKRFMQFTTDALKLIRTNVFRLDVDFDLLLDAKDVHILRPSGFEFLCKTQEAIMASAMGNSNTMAPALAFVDLTTIAAYAGRHPRAARLLASIKSSGNYKNIDRAALSRLCKQNGVTLTPAKGKLVIKAGDEMAFLETLDRRRYELELVKQSPERYRAASRDRV